MSTDNKSGDDRGIELRQIIAEAHTNTMARPAGRRGPYIIPDEPAPSGEREAVVARLVKERDRHVIGYPGPRRDVAELLDHAIDALTTAAAQITSLQQQVSELKGALSGLLRCEYEAAGMGLYDCIDNTGAPYQSADLDKQIKLAEATLSAAQVSK